MSSGGQTVFRLEKNGAGVGRKCAHDDGLEFLQLCARDGMFLYFQLGGEQFSQRIALVDGKRCNDSARIRDGFKPPALAWRQLHSDPPFGIRLQFKGFLAKKGANLRSAPFLLILIVCVFAN